MTNKTPISGVYSVAKFGRVCTLAGTALLLAGCVDGMGTPFGPARLAESPEPAETPEPAPAQVAAGQDVEAPDIFYTAESGLWDGRPSLGGIWVAHPDVVDPERVLIRNTSNGQTVAGALFRRERDNPGPALMVSSDAAVAINVIAGQPTDLEVVALRPQPEPELNIAVPPPDPAAEPTEPTEVEEGTLLADVAPDVPLEADTAAVETATDISALATAALNDVAPNEQDAPALPSEELVAAVVTRAETGQAAIPEAAMTAQVILAATQPEIATDLEAAEIITDATTATDFEVSSLDLPETEAPSPTSPEARPEAVETAATAPTTSAPLERPFIQIAVFTDQENADGAADQMRSAGIIPTINEETGNNGAYWRITVGPAQNSEERAALLDSVRSLGFEDAYFVSN